MTTTFTLEFMGCLLENLAASDWSRDHLHLLAKANGSGVVTSAHEHLTALRALCRIDMGDQTVPLRYCMPSEFHG